MNLWLRLIEGRLRRAVALQSSLSFPAVAPGATWAVLQCACFPLVVMLGSAAGCLLLRRSVDLRALAGVDVRVSIWLRAKGNQSFRAN